MSGLTQVEILPVPDAAVEDVVLVCRVSTRGNRGMIKSGSRRYGVTSAILIAGWQLLCLIEGFRQSLRLHA